VLTECEWEKIFTCGDVREIDGAGYTDATEKNTLEYSDVATIVSCDDDFEAFVVLCLLQDSIFSVDKIFILMYPIK
jgi:predicted nucleic acid-binding protein